MKKIQLGGHKSNSPIRGYAIVDDSDFTSLNRYKWHIAKGYASRNLPRRKGEKNQKRNMHKLIMVAPEGLQIDHINRNKLDNRRVNLRVCSQIVNSMNRGKNKQNKSGFKGVLKDKNGNRSCKWKAGLGFNGKTIFLGYHKTKKEAYKAYQAGVAKYHNV